MKITPKKTIFLVSRLFIGVSALFSGINLLLIYLESGRLMPAALSMTGYLARSGMQITAARGNSFFAIYRFILAGVGCAAFLLCALLAGRNRGWLAVGAVIFLADCLGIGLLILHNGYRSGYWFEIVGHIVILAAFATALCTMPSGKRTAE